MFKNVSMTVTYDKRINCKTYILKNEKDSSKIASVVEHMYDNTVNIRDGKDRERYDGRDASKLIKTLKDILE